MISPSRLGSLAPWARLACVTVSLGMLAGAAPPPHAAASAEAVAPDAQRALPLLVDADWLASHLLDPDLVLLHVGKREGYDGGHIPGARFIELADISTPHQMDDGSLMLELPPPAQLRATLERLGVSDDSRIVVYWGEDWVSPATRVLFTLDYLGLGGRSALLNGGMPAWRRAGNAVTAEAAPIRTGKLRARPVRDVVATLADVRALSGNGRSAPSSSSNGARLLDARAAVFYEGVEEGNGRRGHIPGAASLPFTDVVDDQLMFRPEALARRFRAAGVVPGDTVVAYCHIGQQATAVVFAARVLGIGAKLFDGSMQDWARHAEDPVEAGAGRTP